MSHQTNETDLSPSLIVLGVAQDGGHPQAGCRKPCCADAWNNPELGHLCACLGLVDPTTNQRWMLDCTPDFPAQLNALDHVTSVTESPGLDGIFLTHGHIGHYAGLMHLGREVLGARQVPVWAMPRMRTLLEQSAPWELLSRLDNVVIRDLESDVTVEVNPNLRIRPIPIPHRSEYTETVGFVISGPKRTALYLPDIDKWHRWRSVIDVLNEVDLAFVDGTFFGEGELDRPMSEVPHPSIEESIAFFGALDSGARDKIHFIHMNHTNPLLGPYGAAHQVVEAAGMHLAKQGQRYPL
jgi:pyrroloquinoline quinone biosynthesis protein B